MKRWELIADHKALLTPTGTKILLAKSAIDMVFFDTIAVVLLEYRNLLPADACRNVVAYDKYGKLKWQIDYEVLGQTPYTSLAKENENTVFLYNSVGFFLLVNPVDGVVVEKHVAR